MDTDTTIAKAKEAAMANPNEMPKRTYVPRAKHMDAILGSAVDSPKTVTHVAQTSNDLTTEKPKATRKTTPKDIPLADCVEHHEGDVTLKALFFDKAISTRMAGASMKVLLYMIHNASRYAFRAEIPNTCTISARAVAIDTNLSVSSFYNAIRQLEGLKLLKQIDSDERISTYQLFI